MFIPSVTAYSLGSPEIRSVMAAPLNPFAQYYIPRSLLSMNGRFYYPYLPPPAVGFVSSTTTIYHCSPLLEVEPCCNCYYCLGIKTLPPVYQPCLLPPPPALPSAVGGQMVPQDAIFQPLGEELEERIGSRLFHHGIGKHMQRGPRWRLGANSKRSGCHDGSEVEKEEMEKKTTVMIKNLPNKMKKMQLLEILDEHCKHENKKQLSGGDDDTVMSEFDFFYLPIDFRSGNNKGYAFVNLTSSEAARRLQRHLNRRDWLDLGSRKVCEVWYARVQGLDCLLEHFKHSVFACNDVDCLPVSFIPNRNGVQETVQHYVGRHLPVFKPVTE